jgi:GTP-binding protein
LGSIPNTRTGALVASEPGQVLAHGVANAQERGITFVEPGEEVYAGQVVGQQPRQGDLVVNICRAKKLTNMRASNSDIGIRLVPAVKLSLEQSLDFLADDELLEVTPVAFRLRKRLLNENDRAKERKRTSQQS